MTKPVTKAKIASLEERQAFWARVALGLELDQDSNSPARRDRLKAYELLARAHGDFLDRAQHSGDDSNPLKVVMLSSKKARGG